MKHSFLALLLCLSFALLKPSLARESKPDAAASPPVSTEYKRLLRKEVSLLEAMDDIDENLKRRAFELENLQNRRQKVAVHLMELEVRFEQSTARLDQIRSLIQKRLKSIVHHHKSSRVDVLIDPESSLRTSLRNRVLSKLLESDRSRIQRYRDELENCEVERSLLETKRQELDALEERVSKKRDELDGGREDRLNILRLVEEERSFYEKAYSDLAAAHSSVTEQIQRLKKWPEKKLDFALLKGSFRLPMSYARVLTPFGEKRNKRLRTSTLHPGLEIKSSGSESVRAIYWGRVAFVGPLTGYGTTIIIDHTQGYFTLYARLNKTMVNTGDVIESRQVLGTVGGNSALGNRNTLYFELREKGSAIDPTTWFTSL